MLPAVHSTYMLPFSMISPGAGQITLTRPAPQVSTKSAAYMHPEPSILDNEWDSQLKHMPWNAKSRAKDCSRAPRSAWTRIWKIRRSTYCVETPYSDADNTRSLPQTLLHSSRITRHSSSRRRGTHSSQTCCSRQARGFCSRTLGLTTDCSSWTCRMVSPASRYAVLVCRLAMHSTIPCKDQWMMYIRATL